MTTVAPLVRESPARAQVRQKYHKRQHSVSFSEDVTVMEYECDNCPLTVKKTPLYVSKNLKNSLFLPKQVSKFFDQYNKDEIERRNLMTLLKEMINCRINQKKCAMPVEEAKQFAKLQHLMSPPQKKAESDFISMTTKEKKWLAYNQIYHLNEICTTDYYFEQFMAKHHPKEEFTSTSDFLQNVKPEYIRKHQVSMNEEQLTKCLGKIPVFTVAHARQALEGNIVVPCPDTASHSDLLLTLEYFYTLLIKIREEQDDNLRVTMIEDFGSKLMRVECVPSFLTIEKGQKLYLKFYEICKDRFQFWKIIFQSLNQFFKLNKPTRLLNAFLTPFKIWLSSETTLSNVNVLFKSIEDILNSLIADKFGISVIVLMMTSMSNLKVILKSEEIERKTYVTFVDRLIHCIDNHPHVEHPVLGSRKQLVQFLTAIAPNSIHLKY